MRTSFKCLDGEIRPETINNITYGCRMASPSPHDRSRKDDEDDPVEQMISRTGCAELHYAVQECMAEHQDWRVCQNQVQTFKDCMMSFQKARKEQLIKQRSASTESSPT